MNYRSRDGHQAGSTEARIYRPQQPSAFPYLVGAFLSQLIFVPLWTALLQLCHQRSLQFLQDPFGEFTRYRETMADLILNSPFAVAANAVAQWLVPPCAVALMLFVVLWMRASASHALHGY